MVEEQSESKTSQKHRFTFNLIRQGKYRFYSLTLDSDLLAKICFVTTREEDPKTGFQRVLDKKRAQEIADYIDSGLGTIPNSIILSAQPEASLQLIKNGKIIEFVEKSSSFLILDGQHRVYGFSLAKSKLRVPVVIYNNLTKKEESRLFIDINTKQRPVSNELLLDIKRLAEYHTDSEHLIMQIFDFFNERTDSPLLGLMSPATKSTTKLTRVTFNAALKPLFSIFKEKEIEEIYEIIRDYIHAFIACLAKIDVEQTITKPIVFRAAMQLFKSVVTRVRDRYGSDYTVDNFLDVLNPTFVKAKPSWFTHARAINNLYEKLEKELNDFTL
ncbi:MAG: DGQHR domain-containing protein [Pleurocapsa sp. SU_5_0]|nr:DGQHR domain-containing protein [Pleurocapsa sp. SU_5_0]NJR44600.1 DGQHR domain-containing protein [Hyellaceae cyanobacterium CSU_1_1]